ncbi:MAG: hypothetical protein ACRC1K_24625 [Planctomycetia bacterium]
MSTHPWTTAAILSFALCIGCGGGREAGNVGVVPTPPPPNEVIKAYMTDLAVSGETNSGMELLPSEIEKIKAQDPGKGAAVEAEFLKLKTLQDPAAVKASAKRILSKL